ncbi:MAG: hypothetical protein A4S14_00875 [Proteobacteria bacterium SG_bin9]|nr:MAG: hypothetical protein A4S14_00875 [Proteobacteria bacterium SG_bin9]
MRPAATVVLLSLGPVLAGCGSMSDFSLKDAQWFSGASALTRTYSVEQPPLSPEKPVPADQLISADGACPGLGPSPDAQALAGSDQPAALPPGGKVALGQPECEVARGIGSPDSVNVSAGPNGERVTVLTYMRGPRAGIYRFTAGRLASVERGAEPPPEPKRQPKKQQKRAG